MVGAWAQLVAANKAAELDAAGAQALASSLRVIEEHNLSEYAVTWFLDSASAAVTADIAPRFWAFFEGFAGVKGSKGAAAWASARVPAALRFLSQVLDAQLQVAHALEDSCAGSGKDYGVAARCRANLAAVVFRPVPAYFHEILYLFLSKEFADFARKTASDARRAAAEDDDEEEDSDDEEDGDDSMALDDAEGAHEGETSNFRQVCQSINHVGALSIAEEVLTEVLYDKIAQRIKKRCASRWDTRVLGKDVESWARRSVWPLLRQLHSSVSSASPGADEVMAGEDDEGADRAEDAPTGDATFAFPTASVAGGEAGGGSQTPFRQWRARLELLMYETFTNLRISELFDIIVDFPDSQPALLDLKDSLAKTHQVRVGLFECGARALSSMCMYVCVCVCVRASLSLSLSLPPSLPLSLCGQVATHSAKKKNVAVPPPGHGAAQISL